MTEQLRDEVARALLPGFDNAAEFVRDCALQTADAAIAIVLERAAEEATQAIEEEFCGTWGDFMSDRIRALQEQNKESR